MFPLETLIAFSFPGFSALLYSRFEAILLCAGSASIPMQAPKELLQLVISLDKAQCIMHVGHEPDWTSEASRRAGHDAPAVSSAWSVAVAGKGFVAFWIMII